MTSANERGECGVIGSRRTDRLASESPVPVDIIHGDQLLPAGSSLDSLLAFAAPSFNVSQGADAAMFIRPATLRGLAPDAALVLTNGKRRHRGAIIALLGYGIGGGGQGADLAAIPTIAVERVEVLRDGASAQYGSDAIAGIINIVLRKAREGAHVDFKWGTHKEGDGDAYTLAGNIGLPFGPDGHVSASVEVGQSDPTVRSVQRSDAQALIAAGNGDVPQPVAQIWGLPEVDDNIKLFVDAATELGSAEAYGFGNWSTRTTEGGFYYRNPHTRRGVFQGPVLEDGAPTVKVADLTADGSGNCPPVRILGNRADPEALAALRGNPNCYTLIEKFPGGFTPRFSAKIKDFSATGGIRGAMPQSMGSWRYDLSASLGRSEARFRIRNTINPQLLARRNEIPTDYRVGAYTETDRVLNLDFTRPFDSPAFAGPLNVAFGFEYRDETFKIESGDPNSYYMDPNLEYGLVAQGFDVGSNGAPGFRPSDAGKNTIRAYAAYLDLEGDVGEKGIVGVAARYENYPDFGDTLDGKVSGRWQISDALAIRGALSTGFRAPTAGQANLRNVSTSFTSEDGVSRLVDIAILPPTDPISASRGAVPLKPEQSVNFTIGTVLELGDVSVTADYYSIAIEDRISLTSPFDLSGEENARGIERVRFFSNQQDMDVDGLDVVADWPHQLFEGVSILTLAANLSQVKLTQYNPDYTSESHRSEIEDGRPEFRATATWNYEKGRWGFVTRVRHYGRYYDAVTGGGGWGAFRPRPATVADVELSVRVSDRATLRFGAQNLFDKYPQRNPNPAVASFNGLPYPENSPWGFSGSSYYVRLTWQN